MIPLRVRFRVSSGEVLATGAVALLPPLVLSMVLAVGGPFGLVYRAAIVLTPVLVAASFIRAVQWLATNRPLAADWGRVGLGLLCAGLGAAAMWYIWEVTHTGWGG